MLWAARRLFPAAMMTLVCVVSGAIAAAHPPEFHRARMARQGDVEREPTEADRQAAWFALEFFTTLVGRVVGEGARRQFEGTLTLAGRAASITAPIEVTDAFARVSLELQPTRWGIAPYKALMGAIRLQDRVRITLDAPR